MDDEILSILRAYPQIYLACHVEHRTRQTSSTGLSSREATILAHIDGEGSRPARLAKHLGVARSTLSASLKRLATNGLIRFEKSPRDARRKTIHLTEAGQRAIVSGSVLDEERVAGLLATMTDAERERSVHGLETLAIAVRKMREGEE